MEIIEFKGATKVKNAYVEIEGTQYEVVPAEYSGETPLTPYNINRMQENLLTHIYQLKITSNINAGAEVTLPCYYQVGQEVLDVYLDTERLALSSDDAGADGHYREIGDADSISNKIKTTTDWQLETGDILTLVVRGEYNANT